jgi:hypothetical protein
MKIVADEVVERVKIDACKNYICGREIPIGWGAARSRRKSFGTVSFKSRE